MPIDEIALLTELIPSRSDGLYTLFDLQTAYRLGRDHAWHLERPEEKPLSETNPYLINPTDREFYVNRSVKTSCGVEGIITKNL